MGTLFVYVRCGVELCRWRAVKSPGAVRLEDKIFRVSAA
jgi:hypothetical protein